MFPLAERERGMSLAELVVALAVSSVIGFGLWQGVQSTYAVARQNEARSDSSEQVANLLRRVGDAVSAMQRGGTVVANKKSVTFVTKVFKDGVSRPVTATVRNQCVKARFVRFDAATVDASPAWRACPDAPRCGPGMVPSIVFEGTSSKALSVPANTEPTVGPQRLIGAYFCASALSANQISLTVVDVRTPESSAQSLLKAERTLVVGYNTRLSERVQLFLTSGGKK